MSINIGLVHIGEAIEKRLKTLKYTQEDFANMRNVTQPTVYAMLKKSSIDTDKLREISLQLDYNFFEDFCPDLKNLKKEAENSSINNSEDGNKSEKELIKEMNFLREENIRKSKQIENLLKIVSQLTKNKEISETKRVASV